MKPAPGQFYRVVHQQDDDRPLGSIVLLTEISEDGRYLISCQDSTSSWYMDDEDLDREMKPIEDGQAAIRFAIQKEMQEIAAFQKESENVKGLLAQAATPGGFEPAASGEISEKALAPIVRDIAQTKAKIKTARNDMARINAEVKKRQAAIKSLVWLQKKQMESMLAAQMAELEGKLGGLNEMIGRAEEAIWTINLYLGKDEQILQITKGEPAPKDTKITIRQLVLYADEECAINADEDGIDFTKLSVFDEWVKDPKHRQQLLPEPKGVVAIKVRRSNKDYGKDATGWAVAEAHAKNKKTYFLMVNGENVYRICTELEVSDHLIPTETEHQDLFFTSGWDSEAHEYKREPVYPGDKLYMEAMDKAEALKKHYMRVLLFLQGLLDRTAVFAPLPAPRLNILDRRVHNDHLSFVRDAEKLLTDGRPSFYEWLDKVNAHLDIGHRIVGSFNGHWGLRSLNYEGHRFGNERISPKGASFPNDLEIYTIEGSRERGWFFRYNRDDIVYRRGYGSESGPPKRRASCAVSSADRFILNVDEATIEDMEYYLTDRTNRSEYSRMFPLLRRAIEIKEQEKKTETPFRALLVNHIAKKQNLKAADVEKDIDAVIAWWKLKNKIHRALVADDEAKAYRMILKEFAARREREAVRDLLSDINKPLVEKVLAAHPNAVCIAHTEGNTYAALVPHNDENVYVEWQEWSMGGKLDAARPWYIPEKKRLLTWAILYTSERWKDWKVDARENDYLTDPEREQVIDEARALLTKHGALAAVTHHKPGDMRFWIYANPGTVPSYLLQGDWTHPKIVCRQYMWMKKQGVVTVHGGGNYGAYDMRSADDRLTPWESESEKLLFTEPKVLEQIAKDRDVYGRALKRKRALDNIASHVLWLNHEAAKVEALEEEKRKFLEEYEHEELWEDHKKTVNVSPGYSWRLRSAVEYVIDHGPQVPSRAVAWLEQLTTVEALMERAMRDDWKYKSPKRASWESEKEDGPIVMSTVLTFEDDFKEHLEDETE